MKAIGNLYFLAILAALAVMVAFLSQPMGRDKNEPAHYAQGADGDPDISSSEPIERCGRYNP